MIEVKSLRRSACDAYCDGREGIEEAGKGIPEERTEGGGAGGRGGLEGI